MRHPVWLGVLHLIPLFLMTFSQHAAAPPGFRWQSFVSPPQLPHVRLQHVWPSADVMPSSQTCGARMHPVSSGVAQTTPACTMDLAQHFPDPPSRFSQPISVSPQVPQVVAQHGRTPFAVCPDFRPVAQRAEVFCALAKKGEEKTTARRKRVLKRSNAVISTVRARRTAAACSTTTASIYSNFSHNAEFLGVSERDERRIGGEGERGLAPQWMTDERRRNNYLRGRDEEGKQKKKSPERGRRGPIFLFLLNLPLLRVLLYLPLCRKSSVVLPK